MIADTLSEMLSELFGWLVVAYFVGLAIWFVAGVTCTLFAWIYDDLIPRIQGRHARALRTERPAQIPRRIDLRDSEKVDVWLYGLNR